MDTRDTGRMPPAPESPDAAQDAGDPENCEHWCPRCEGEGTIDVYENGGPDALLVAECCPHCDGSGTLYGAYKALAAQVQREHTKYLQVSGKLYFMEPTITRLTAERDAALRDAERWRALLTRVLDTREAEAKAWFAAENARNNFSGGAAAEEKAHLRAMHVASVVERHARAARSAQERGNV